MSQKQELAKKIIADGKVDTDEVTQLRTTFMADGSIDREEMDLLFEINTATSGAANCPSFKTFFVEAVSSNILGDGSVDEDEAVYLADKLLADGEVDDNEKALLTELKAKAKGAIPAKLTELFSKFL